MSDETTAETESDPLTPETRALPMRPGGTPVMLADGREWTLAGHVPRLGGIWDTLFDDNVLAGRYEPADLRTAALHLLARNYRVTLEEGYALLVGVPAGSLMPAVERAMFGPDEVHRTFSDWAKVAFLIAGVDLASIPEDGVLAALDALEMAGRIPNRADWISSAEYASKRSALLNFGKDEG